MNNFLLILLLPFVNLFSTPENMANQTTTFIIVRHAEKDGQGKDPNLSADGKARAEELRHMLVDVPVHAIYSTAYNRTRQTVAPLAAQRGITIAEYNAVKPAKQLADEWLTAHSGKTVVVCGHSNTVPELVNALGKNATAITIDEPHFDNIFIVTCPETDAPSVVQLKYGKATP
jgi:2,3-bisphosphoglycerate-dependent phosphoglycerate mutase